MLDLLNTIKESSTPELLIGGGLIFLLLAIVDTIRGQVTVAPARQRVAGVLGAALLLAGIAIQLAPAVLRAPAVASVPTPALVPSVQAETTPAPATVAPTSEAARKVAPATAVPATEIPPTSAPPTAAPPTSAPPTAVPPTAPPAPEASLRTYWQAVSERRYADAWALLSANFRWTTHGNSFDDYVQGYAAQGLCGVAPEQLAVVAQAEDYAQIEATLIYRKGADCTASALALRFHMVPAAESLGWVIDRVELR